MGNKGNGCDQSKNGYGYDYKRIGNKFTSQLNVKTKEDYAKYPHGILNALVSKGSHDIKVHKPEEVALDKKHKNKSFGFNLKKYIPKNKEQENALNAVHKWRPGDKSIFLFGTVGAGKTHLLKAMHDRIILSNHFKDKTIEYVLSTQLASDLADYKTPDFSMVVWPSKEGSKSECKLHTAKNVDIFFLEDLGQENTTEHFKSKLYEIIDHRINFKKPTFVDSNLTKEELVKAYGGGLADRLINSFQSVECSSQQSGREVFGTSN